MNSLNHEFYGLTHDERQLLRDDEIIGVKWDTASNNPTLAHVNSDLETVAVSSRFFNNHPIYDSIKRYNLNDEGVETAVYGDSNFAYDGSNGQVMSKLNKMWYRSFEEDTDRYYFISPYDTTGFKRHPAWITNNKNIDKFYWGSFEGCVYDKSGAAYNTTDAAGVDFTATTGDVLSSVAGVKPISGENNALTRAKSRILAENRGVGWQLIDFNQVSALQLLFMVRYGTLNSQSIFKGVTDLPSGIGNGSINTGYTAGVGVGSSDLGNTSGEVSVLATQPFSFYGIENFYGNIWKWVDGINIMADYNPWIADNSYVDDSFTAPYVNTGLTLASANGFVKAINFDSENDYFFLTSDVTGSNSTYLCDYYYQATGNRIAKFGGCWADGAYAGAFSWFLRRSAADSYRSFGSRIAYVPQ